MSAPPRDPVSLASQPAGAKAADAKLQATVESFLKSWPTDHAIDTAAAAFLPESYSCDVSDGMVNVAGDGRVRSFLTEIVALSKKEKTLDRAITTAEAGHRGLKPLTMNMTVPTFWPRLRVK